MSRVATPNLVMIHQSWLKKMPAEPGKVALKKGFVLKIGIFKANLRPLEHDLSIVNIL